MLVTHQTERKTIREVLLFALATLLGLVLSARLAAADVLEHRLHPPRLLDASVIATAEPIVSDWPAGETKTVGQELMQIMAAQRDGHWELAIAGWDRISLPCESEVWRRVGLGSAYLQAGDLSAASAELAIAVKLDPRNAAAYYFLELLRLSQADIASEWYDAIYTSDTRMVSHAVLPGGSDQQLSKTKGRYELEAMSALETAIVLSADLDKAAPLIPVYMSTRVPVALTPEPSPPTVNDLLEALDADNLAGRSHGLLAQLYLDRRAPESAEYHVDEALALGFSVPLGYRHIAELYEEQGRNRDAFRAHLKSINQGHGTLGPVMKAFESLGRVGI